MQNTITLILGILTSSFLVGCLNQGNSFKPTHTVVSVSQSSPFDPTKAILTQCSAELFRPAVFREEPFKVLIYDGSASYSNIPAEMAQSETKIQVEPSRHAEETEPAQYAEVEETIEVERARSELYATPAQYQKVIREILIKPEHKQWKSACLASSNSSSCLETIHAERVKIPTQVIIEPAQIHQRSLPAKTIKIKRKKLIKAGKGSGSTLPARYTTVKLMRVIKPWKIISSLVPTQYETISIQRKLRDEQVSMMPIACTDTLKPEQIRLIQQALLQAGQSLSLSGVLDTSTIAALHTFQAANQLAIGGLSLETLRKLGLT